MNPVAFDTDTFMRARVVASTSHSPGGSAHNAAAFWWRRNHPVPGATWHLSYAGITAGGPAVVDDFGDLVLAEVRP